MNTFFKYLILSSLITCIFSCSETGYSKASCDKIYFYDDNQKNDTNKVLFEGRVLFDTTANMLSGVIVDSLTNKPIVGAEIYISSHSKNYFDSTNSNGGFSFFRNNFSGQYQMMVVHSNYKCLVIDNINVSGGLKMRIKLHEWFTKP